MSDSVLSVKYRPVKLSEIIGQPSIVTTLTNAVATNRLHHAYLFHGNLGCGKTSTARCFASMINCEHGPTIDPCGTCKYCKAIRACKLDDVVEMDAASNGKVEEIRQLRTSAYYAPTTGARYKIYIIDECLPASAQVTMADGSKRPIGEMVEAHLNGDETQVDAVKGRDPRTSEEVVHKVSRYIRIANDKQMYKVRIQDENGEIHTLLVTGNHDIISGGTKIKAKNLAAGDSVTLED